MRNSRERTRIRKSVLSLVACCAVAILMMPCAIAAETTIDNQGHDTVTINGTVEATILTADVTLSAPFAILPNEPDSADRFISPTISVENKSTVPVDLTVKSLKHVADAPAVVAQDKYTDAQWATLGKADTKANIALGLQYNGTNSASDKTVAAKSYWFAAEASQTEHYLKQLSVNETLEMTMQAKHGLAWAQADTMDYQMVFGLSLPD